MRKYLEEHERNMVYRIFPHVERFLESLRAEGIPAAVVTSSNEQKMDGLYRQLPGFRDYFDLVVTDADVKRSKPDPEGYILAAQRLGVPSEFCAVFEDSRAGLEAARRAGGKVVAMATTLLPCDIAGCGDIVLDSFENFTPESLRGLFE